MPFTSHNASTVPVVSHDQNVIGPHFYHLGLTNAMVSLMMLSASHYADINTNGNTWYQHQCQRHHAMQMASHDKNFMLHLIPFVNIRNWMVPLMMLLAPCDTEASASGIKLSKNHVASHLDCLEVRNAVVPFLLPVSSCNANTSASGITWPKLSCYTTFDHLELTNVVASFNNPSA